MLATIFWDFPNHIPLFGFELRFYSLMFIISFVLGQYGMQYVFKRENINPKLMDSLVYWMIGATIVGARLGHVFFYDWDKYKDNLGDIFKVWEGGLASHGAAIAIVVAMIYWSRKYAKIHPLWTLDRIVIVVALAAGFIRMGNWFNSEIYGAPANSTFETVFVEDAAQSIRRGFAGQVKSIEFQKTGATLETDSLTYPEMDLTISFHQSNETQTLQYVTTYLPEIIKLQSPDNKNLILSDDFTSEVYEGADGWEASMKVFGIPRYPTQLFEAGAYWIIFVILALLYLKRSAGDKRGFLLGVFLTLLFGFRFFIEYYKEIQVSFEAGMDLNMGQWLSIPLVCLGLYLIIRAQKTA